MRAPLLRALAPLLPSLGLGAQPASVAAAAAASAATRGVKTTTGIVGLPVVEDARNELKRQLQAVLEAVAVIPETAEYRRAVEKTVRFKLAAVEGDQPDEALEELFSRQLEEEIKMCKEELGLIPKMAEWKPWEVPEGHTIPMMEEQYAEGTERGAKQVPTPQ